MSASIGNGLFSSDLYPQQVPATTPSPLQTLAALQAKSGSPVQNNGAPVQQGNGLYTGQQPMQQTPQSNTGGMLNSNSSGAQVLNMLNGTSGQSPLAMLSGALGGPTNANGLMQQVGSALAPAGQYGPFQPASSVMSALNPFASSAAGATDAASAAGASDAAAATPGFFDALLAMF